MMEEIVIPDLDDDDDFVMPPLSRAAFGTPAGSPDSSEIHGYRGDHSFSSESPLPSVPRGGGGGGGGSVQRPTPVPKSSLGFSASSHDLAALDPPPRLGKQSNGSVTSLGSHHHAHASGSGSGLLNSKSRSFASLKNVFKGTDKGGPPPPPVPSWDSKPPSAGYPTLKNPFSMAPPASPTSSTAIAAFGNRPRANTKASVSSITHYGERNKSVATMHSSQRSFGARSTRSEASSTFRAEDYPMPAMPRIPNRSTPSRAGRQGSDTSMFGSFGRNTSISGDDTLENFGKTPAEEALKVLFNAFREVADNKIKKLLAKPLNSAVSLSAALEPGVDTAFDELLVSLANCARRHARRVLDILSAWCRQQCEPMQTNEVRNLLSQSMGLQLRTEDAAMTLGARKSASARYIYHRALIEIVRVVPPDVLGEDVALNLEHAAFSLFRSERSDENTHRRPISTLLVDFLGELSKTRFLTVSDRFLRELSGLSSIASSKDQEAKIEHILKGVRHLKLRVYPEPDLERAADFVQDLSAFFANAHGSALKCAYAETFTYLLHPVIESATAEVNHPVWSKAIAVVLQRAMLMATKPRYWSVAFPLVVVALGVSPREVFMEHWQGCIDIIAAKSKDRGMRLIGMNAFIRLLWIYLNRCPESSTSTRKRLEPLLRGYFPLHTRQLHPDDLGVEPFVTMLHYVLARQFDYGQELVTEFLRDSVTSRTADGTPGDILHAERAFIAVRAVTHTLRCIAEQRAVVFPTSADFSRFDLDKFSCKPDEPTISDSPEAEEFMKKCGPTLMNVLQSCDRSVGNVLLSSDFITLSAHASSASWESSGDQVTCKHGDVHVAYPKRFNPTFRLLTALLDAVRSLLPIVPNITNFINILCRSTFSADPMTCEVASSTMRRIADDPAHCIVLVDNYRQFVFETRNVFRDHFVGTRLLDSQLVRVVTLWVDMLESLAAHQRTAEKPEPVDISFVHKVEATGLFLLCSSSVNLRKLAHQVFTAASDLIGQNREPSAPFRYSRLVIDVPTISAVLQVYDCNTTEADLVTMRKIATLSSNDRHRLDTHKAATKLMRKIAESDSPKDSALWACLLPAFIAKTADQLPKPVKELQLLIAQTVVRLQNHVAVTASTKPQARPTGVTVNRSVSDGTMLADQWRQYLAVLCATVDSAGVVTQGSRKDQTLSAELLMTPQLFPYLVQTLNWDDRRFQDAAVYALGSIRQSSLRSLSEALVTHVRRLSDSYRNFNSQGGGNFTRRPTAQGALWTAFAHVFRLISPLILEGRSSAYLTNLSSLIQFVKITLGLLADPAYRDDYELQSLRRYFCIVVDNLTTALGQLDSSDRFLGEEHRGAIFKLCYDWCHVGRRPDVAKARESATLQAAADSYRGERDKAQYLDDLQAKTKLLSAAAAEAMASLCLGKLITAADSTPAGQASEHVVDPLTVLRWVRGMLQTSSTAHHDTARKALHALIKYNWGVARLADEVLHQAFGEGEHFSLDSSFFGVVADMIGEGTIKLPPAQLACLSLSKLGHPVSDVRHRAFQLAVWLFHDAADQLAVGALLPAVGSAAPNAYRQAQLEMATRLANLYPNLALPFLAECTARLGQLEAPRRHATLSILPPFLQVLELEADTSKLGPDEIARDHEALSNLTYLVVRFTDDHIDDIRDIIVSFAGSGRARNTTALVKFLFEQGAKRSPDFVQHAQQIISCLANSPAADITFEEIYGFVHPSDMATSAQANVPSSPATSLANLDALFGASQQRSTKPMSQGQMALLFAGELLPHRLSHPALSSRLPTLLHVAFILCDDSNAIMRDQAQRVLFQVLRAMVCNLTNVHTAEAGDQAAIWAAAELKTTALARSRATAFWKTDDAGSPETVFHAPEKMASMVGKILGSLQQLQPKLRQQWGALALDWATSCTIRHLACRSFQVFRILSPDIGPRMVSDVLARLSSTIASSSPEIQAFNNEVMRTFACIVQSISPADMHNYPQIFWCSMTCLTTPYESEFNEVVDLLSHVLDKTNLADPAVVTQLMSFRPKDLTGPPPHLQALLLIGLRSSKTDMMTFDVIRRLTSVPNSELIDSQDDRLVNGFVAALPWMLHSTDLGEPNEELACMATDLAEIAEQQGQAGIARLLTSFARARFRTKDDFIRQAASLLRERLATHALQIVTLLLGFVLNRNDWMRDKALQILKLLLSFPEVRAPLAPHSRELVRPLLRLVSTKHGAQALEILDLPFSTPDPAVPESSDQLFGPFESSGWSIPNANERSEVTRNNVHAVFNTCAVESRAASAHFSVLQFSDLRSGPTNPSQSQVSLELPSPPMSVPDNASMGDLVGALHSLNQFFDDGLDGGNTSPLAPRRTAAMAHYARGSSSESLGVARIMARGIVRSPSASLSGHSMSGHSGHGHSHSHLSEQVEGYSLEPHRYEPPRFDHRGYATSTDSHSHAGSDTTSLPRIGNGHGTEASNEYIYFPPSNGVQFAQAYGSGSSGASHGHGHGQGNGNGNGFNTAKRGGLYVHAAHKPSFSSESEFGAAASDNVFSLDDSGGEAALKALGDDDILDTPVHRPWNGSDRSRTPSPRDAPV